MRTIEATSQQNNSDERGAVSFIVAIFIFTFIFIAVAALAADLSQTANRGQELQSASDAAALAAVVEYEESLIATPGDFGLAEGLARAKALEVLRQNGINIASGDITPFVTFPAGGGRVKVLIEDTTAAGALSPASRVLPFEHLVERSSTAEFLGCDSTCTIALPIPKPITDIEADADGDGFIPIEVGKELYAINHNSGSNQIICVDTETKAPCWTEGDVVGAPEEVGRRSYNSGVFDDNSPEMPHTGVVDDKIWWSASDSAGHRLYCYDTVTGRPCPGDGWPLSDEPRGTVGSTPDAVTHVKDESRGGGTVAFRDKVYAFTDNHEIHCWDPAAANYCAGYTGTYGGMPTGLAVFPDNDPDEGNHGGSIDRIVDPTTGFIYSTIHIPNAVDSLNCAAAISVTNLDDLNDATGAISEIVVIESGGRWLSGIGDEDVQMTNDVTQELVRWQIERAAGSSDVYFRAIGIDLWLDAEHVDLTTLPKPPETSTNKLESDNVWLLAPSSGGFIIESQAAPATFLYTNALGAAVQGPGGSTSWNVSKCVDPARDAGYAPGTWLHCFNTGEIPTPSGVTDPGTCPGFVSDAPIHPNATRFSGRLFFNRDPAPAGVAATTSAVCSSGYQNPGGTGGNPTRINCVDLATGAPDTSTNFSALEARITAGTSSSPSAWGVPHYNTFQNRLVYPTHWSSGIVLCWDFDSPGTVCGEFKGQTDISAVNPGQTTGDYGFISKGNCVFALGHLEYFWAFQAGDFGKPCVGATSQTDINKCPCTGGVSRWGVLDFEDVNLDDFDVLRMKITTDPANDDVPGVELYPLKPGPPRDSWHELKPLGESVEIDLDAIPEIAALPVGVTSIRLLFYVEAPSDPFGGASIPQAELAQRNRPRLIE